MTNNALRDVVSAIIEAAEELHGKTNPDAQDYGQLLAYAETLSIIRDACDPDNLKAVGLDFDIDRRFL